MGPKSIILGERYELIEVLGGGGMSEVWKARHIHLDKLVAIKLLRADLPGKEDVLARFRQEAQIASKLVHDNVCTVTDFGFTPEDVPFIVMEYLEGETLRQVLGRMKRLPVGAAFSITRSILSGLEAAHAMGIVHRDIKPANVIIAMGKEGRRTVKILDFGISKVIFGGTSSLVDTVTGRLLGTAYYLSPEQIMESKSVDPRTDVYATGAVLYKMVTGSVPFGGRNVGEVSVKIARSALVDPRKYVRSLDASVVKVIHKAMEKDAGTRYQSASEMLRDIEALDIDSSGAALEALYGEKGAGAPGKAGAVSARRKIVAAVILSLTLAAALVLGLVFYPQLRRLLPAPGGAAQKPAVDAGGGGARDPEAAVLSHPVKIRFTSLPAGTKIRIGGKVLSGDSVEVERSSDAMVVALHADGYITKNIHVIPDSDLEIDGSLVPLAGPDSGAEDAEAPEAASGHKKHGSKGHVGSGPDRGEKKQGEKMQFIRTLDETD